MSNVWMRNLTTFALRDWVDVGMEDIQTGLETRQFRGIASLEKEHRGFTNVFDQDGLVYKCGDAYWVQVKTEQKKVPGAQLKRLLAERMEEIEKREFRKVGRKEKKELQEAISDELLAKVEPTQSTVTAAIDPTTGYIFIDTASMKTAEAVLSLLVHTVPGLKVGVLDFVNRIPDKVTEILLAEEAGEFVADASLVLKGEGTPAATVRFAQCNLSDPEVVAHLSKGLRPASVALTWDGRISFVLTDPLALRRLAYLDLVQDEIDSFNDVDAQTQLNGLLTLQIGEIRELFEAVTNWLVLKDASADGTPT